MPNTSRCSGTRSNDVPESLICTHKLLKTRKVMASHLQCMCEKFCKGVCLFLSFGGNSRGMGYIFYAFLSVLSTYLQIFNIFSNILLKFVFSLTFLSKFLWLHKIKGITFSFKDCSLDFLRDIVVQMGHSR